jgi:hypothetical protein
MDEKNYKMTDFKFLNDAFGSNEYSVFEQGFYSKTHTRIQVE